MGWTLNPPPGWPSPPPGWKPPPGWQPDPSWPPPPAGWQLWIPEEAPTAPRSKKTGAMWGVIGGVVAIAALIVSWFAWINPNPGQQPSSLEERQSYIQSVDALCQQALEATATVAGVDATSAQYIDATTFVADTYEQLWSDWAAMPLPNENDGALIRPMLDSLETMINSTRELGEWVSLGAAAEADEEFDRIREHSDDLRRAARAYGFQVCHSLGPP